jgi:hypothetical protein
MEGGRAVWPIFLARPEGPGFRWGARPEDRPAAEAGEGNRHRTRAVRASAARRRERSRAAGDDASRRVSLGGLK